MSFADDMKKMSEKIGEKYDATVRASLIDVASKVILRTAVDTGRARGNWQVSLNDPASGIVEEDADTGSGVAAPNPSKSSEKAIRAAVDNTENATGNIWWLTNNLPYIQKLESGTHSQQSPSGMVRVTLEEFESALKKFINEP